MRKATFLTATAVLLAMTAAEPLWTQDATAESAAEAAPEQEPAAAAPAGLQDIVVTAQRRSENLQDVPIAVSAFSAPCEVTDASAEIANRFSSARLTSGRTALSFSIF